MDWLTKILSLDRGDGFYQVIPFIAIIRDRFRLVLRQNLRGPLEDFSEEGAVLPFSMLSVSLLGFVLGLNILDGQRY